jgi:hypothetical protein
MYQPTVEIPRGFSGDNPATFLGVACSPGTRKRLVCDAAVATGVSWLCMPVCAYVFPLLPHVLARVLLPVLPLVLGQQPCMYSTTAVCF